MEVALVEAAAALQREDSTASSNGGETLNLTRKGQIPSCKPCGFYRASRLRDNHSNIPIPCFRVLGFLNKDPTLGITEPPRRRFQISLLCHLIKSSVCCSEVSALLPVKVNVLVVQSFLILWYLMDCSPPGSMVLVTIYMSMEFCRHKYWSRLTFPSPGDLPNPGIKPRSPALQANSLPSELPGKASSTRGGNIFFVGYQRGSCFRHELLINGLLCLTSLQRNNTTL